MKKLIICFVLWGSMLNAQFFESESSEIMQNQSAFNTTPIEDPDQGVDNGGGNPSFPIPINQWLLILPMIGLLLAIQYNRSKRLKT